MRAAFSMPIRVTFRDLDALGHVNNAVYFTYLETARITHLLKLMGKQSLRELGVIVAHASCNFRSPASFGETLIVSLRPTAIGETSWTYEYEIVEKKTGRLVADAKTVQVMYDYSHGKKMKIPARLRRKLKALVST